MKLVIATHNAHKVAELRIILGAQLEGIELISYDGPEPVEDGLTFEANALIKARAAAAHTGLPSIADDSGICVDVLDGAPGIHSARYAGTRDDGDNRRVLLENLAGQSNRAAQFVCAAALVVPPSGGSGLPSAHVTVGTWPGDVLLKAVGEGGFGYDPIFAPHGYSVSSAQLSTQEKNTVSHRAIAFGQIIEVVRRELVR